MARHTKEEALATRNRLLDAAELLFQAQGVSQTSLQQIAQQAGATRGAIYWHFKDKADLFNAMMERVTLPLEAAARSTGPVRDDPLEEIERGLLVALKLMTTDPQVRRVFEVATHKVEYTHDMQSVQQRHLSARDACVTDFEQALRHASRRQHVRLAIPAAAAAQGLHALVSGLIQNWLLDPSAFDLVQVGKRTFEVYVNGLGFGHRPDAIEILPEKLSMVA
ncbi:MULTISPECIES: TetR family transcriptional regulator [unclassified Variovorax]|uniref:TetR family transcriptional regulator n=1 Tax=unclassified Variovorax TaxID=663243 RepID=UPI002576661D|nr:MULTISPECIES: TetR family transcriptional regulator [unclassified Variovorax]MDM0089645.1 TetR family transcriptional regulator [Variovorax sp. J22G40]MDM0148689.1 TetR family transcriptional regulator [Variovorax sp. J2P1-31]